MRKRIRTVAATIIFTHLIAVTAWADEEMQYRKVKVENAACELGILYKKTGEGMDIGVSAVATGRGAEFRKWKVTKIKLKIGSERIRPDVSGKFFVRQESFMRVPAAVLFAIIGATYQAPDGTSKFDENLGRIGLALGLGLLVLQAKGDIPGERRIFRLGKETAGRIAYGKDAIEITIENPEKHQVRDIAVGITRPPAEAEAAPGYDKMTRDELGRLVDELGSKVAALERRQSDYKYGRDPQYDEIQSKIEGLRTEQGKVFKIWAEKE
ncbi:MAG: hypothetical protein JW919_01345 [Candidatus Omnitrophica bacterium]|nr:hypothetical protein [Candidatus Omnitrophota bacterium]